MTADNLLWFLAGIAYTVALSGIFLFLILHRREPKPEPLTKAEREFLQVVGRARR